MQESDLTQGYPVFLPYSANHLNTQVEGFLFPAFGEGVNPGFADNGDGTVVYNYISDQFRLYLEFMNKLYTEKILEPEIYSLDTASVLARVKSGQMAFGTYVANLLPEDFPDGQIHLDCLAPLTSEYTSTQKVGSYNYLSTSVGGINKDCKYVEEILRMLDIGYAKEEVAPGTGLDAIACNMGIKGISYTVNEEDHTYAFNAPEDWKVAFGIMSVKTMAGMSSMVFMTLAITTLPQMPMHVKKA